MPVTLVWVVRISAERICDECYVGTVAVGEISEAADGCRVVEFYSRVWVHPVVV